jgi:O-antigen ligase
VSQALRLEMNLPDFDAPSRLFAATAVYLALRRSRLSPQVIMSALMAGIVLGIPSAWWGMTAESISAWGNRFATPHSDTNAFGSFMGLFVCMLSGTHMLRTRLPSRGFEVLLCIGLSASITLAVYLLMGTYGRGAWISTLLGLIMVAGVVAYARPQGLKERVLWLLVGLVAAPIAMGLLAPETFNSILGRAQSIATEVIGWQQDLDMNSSGGIRLEMNAAAFELFLRAPISGYGDLGYAAAAREPWMTTRYSEVLIRILTTAGPHNEFWARTLQSGIWGAMAMGFFFVIPTATFSRTLRVRTQEATFTGGVGLVAMSYLFLVQFSNEFSLKYIASFVAILLAVMLASASNLLKDHGDA